MTFAPDEDRYLRRAEIYVQCWLRNKNRQQVTWLPEKFAVVDSVVRLRQSAAGEWDDGWIVVATYQRTLRPRELETARRYFEKRLK